MSQLISDLIDPRVLFFLMVVAIAIIVYYIVTRYYAPNHPAYRYRRHRHHP